MEGWGKNKSFSFAFPEKGGKAKFFLASMMMMPWSKCVIPGKAKWGILKQKLQIELYVFSQVKVRNNFLEGKIASTTVRFFPNKGTQDIFPAAKENVVSLLLWKRGRDERGASQLNQITKKTERTLERFPLSLQQPEPPHLEQPLFNDPPPLPALCLEILLPPFPSFFSLKFVDF